MKVFGVTPALVGVALLAQRGSVCGLIGGNGAGKTTLLRCVATALRPTLGHVAFLPERTDLRARFGFALARTGRPDEALEQLRLAVRAAPRLPYTRLYLGALLMQTGKKREARAQ